MISPSGSEVIGVTTAWQGDKFRAFPVAILRDGSVYFFGNNEEWSPLPAVPGTPAHRLGARPDVATSAHTASPAPMGEL